MKEMDPRSSADLFSKNKLVLEPELDVAGKRISVDRILTTLSPLLTDGRREKLKNVVSHRSLDVVSVLENIHDRGNVSAAMRSADAFGFCRMHLLDPPGSKFRAANRVSKGAEKWLDVHLHTEPAETVSTLKNRGYRVFATHLEATHEIEELDFASPIAIVLGNEKDGVSPDMISRVDGTFKIPMYGFSQSFNISVAAALVFQYAKLRRPKTVGVDSVVYKQILANYYLRCFDSPEMYFTSESL